MQQILILGGGAAGLAAALAAAQTAEGRAHITSTPSLDRWCSSRASTSAA